MDLAELIALIHQESIADFIPLREIPDEETRREYQERLQEQFYQFPYHYQSFQEAYPNLNPDWVYCNRGISPLYYWEEDTGILLKIPVELEGLEAGALAGRENVEAIVLRELAQYRKETAKQDYSHVLYSLNGAMKMEYLDYLIEQKRPIQDLFSLFHACYVSTDFGAAAISRENLEYVINTMTADEKSATTKKTESLPEVVTIYRGEGARSTSWEKAYSWTLDVNTALFYAVRLGEEKSRIIKATVEKKDILCFGSDSDAEVLVFPEAVSEQEIYRQKDLAVLEEKLEQFGFLSQVYTEDLQSNRIRGHDAMHALRTMLLAEILYDARHPDESFGSNQQALVLAAAYHDTGRSQDGDEFLHSNASCERFRKAGYGESERAKLAEFLIRFHETESPLPHSILEAEFPEKEVVVEELLAIFQDADALDRLRFGYRSEDRLDFNRLRLSESREMILMSRILNDQLTDPELVWDIKETAEDNNMEIQEQAR